MNGTEQRTHKTAMDALGKRVDDVEVVTDELDTKIAAMATAASTEIASGVAQAIAQNASSERRITAAQMKLAARLELLEYANSRRFVVRIRKRIESWRTPKTS